MQSRARKALGESEGERSIYTREFVRTGFKDDFKLSRPTKIRKLEKR